MTHRRVLSALALALGLLRPVSGSAAELRYTAPRRCPSAEELAFRVERGLGKSLELVPTSHFGVEIREETGTFTAKLSAPDAEAQTRVRELSAPDCSQLVEALSVAIVLAIAELETEDTPTPESPEPAPSPADAIDAPASPTPEPGAEALSSETTTNTSFGVSLWLLGDIGSLPSAAPGVGLSAQIGLSKVWLRALGAIWLDQHVDLPLDVSPPPGADLSFFSGSLSGCYEARPGGSDGISLSGCLTLELGRLSGRGTDIDAPLDGSVLSLGAGAGIELRWRPPGSEVQLHAQIGALVPFNQNEFFLRDIGEVHRSANVVGRAGIGVGWAL